MKADLTVVDSMNRPVAVELDAINIKYDSEHILKDLSITFEHGKSYTIIGPSGCGKTTLLYTIAGLNNTVSGTIRFGNPDVKNHIAMVLQEYGLFPWKTVWQNLILGYVIRHGALEDSESIRAKKLAADLGLEAHLEKYPHQLSGGQKQRVALARSWLLTPEIMLMDEPFSAIDTITRENLQNTIIDLSKERALTWITVTHNIEEAVFLGSEILLMSQTGGAIIKRIVNPYFGDVHLREKPEFYALCLQIRKAMQEVHDEA